MAAKQISCVQCQTEFEFTDEDRARLENLVTMKKIDQWTEPKRCLPCRQARKKAGGSGQGTGGERKELFAAKCSQCGGEARVPFKPRGDRPVYCSTCFSAQRK